MALTVSSYVFKCTREQAEEVAGLASLRHSPYITGYELWEDAQTGGGGCRIVWCQGIAWISRHSGYPQADKTEEVAFWFESVLLCRPFDDPGQHLNPSIYGFSNWRRDERSEYHLPR